MTGNFANDEAPPADLAESLRLIQEGRAEAARRLRPDPRLQFWPWGVSWLISFALFFLRFGPNGHVFVDMPAWLPGVVLGVTLFTAGMISGRSGARAYRQVTGESDRRGAMYGWSWFLAFASMGTILSRATEWVPDAEAGMLWSASAVAITGVLHIAGGAIWLDRSLFRLGMWITLSNIAGVIAGPGWHSLVVCLAGGGGMLVAGTVAWRRYRTGDGE